MQWEQLRLGASRLILDLYYWIVKVFKALISKSGLTAISVVALSFSLTRFYYILAYIQMDYMQCIWFKDKWRNAILGIGTALIFLFQWWGIEGRIQAQLINVFKVVIVYTYAIVVANYFLLIGDPYPWFLYCTVGVFVTTSMILFSAIKHDFLQE